MVVTRIKNAIQGVKRIPMKVAKAAYRHKGKLAAGAALAYGAHKAYKTGKDLHKVLNGVGKITGQGMGGIVKAGMAMR